MNRAIRMMIGMGMPSIHNSIERMGDLQIQRAVRAVV